MLRTLIISEMLYEKTKLICALACAVNLQPPGFTAHCLPQRFFLVFISFPVLLSFSLAALSCYLTLFLLFFLHFSLLLHSLATYLCWAYQRFSVVLSVVVRKKMFHISSHVG